MTALNEQIGGSHYKDYEIQPIEFIHRNKIPFPEGCVIKYMCRWKSKGGISDLEKAKHYIELLIELSTNCDESKIEKNQFCSCNECDCIEGKFFLSQNKIKHEIDCCCKCHKETLCMDKSEEKVSVNQRKIYLKDNKLACIKCMRPYNECDYAEGCEEYIKSKETFCMNKFQATTSCDGCGHFLKEDSIMRSVCDCDCHKETKDA